MCYLQPHHASPTVGGCGNAKNVHATGLLHRAYNDVVAALCVEDGLETSEPAPRLVVVLDDGGGSSGWVSTTDGGGGQLCRDPQAQRVICTATHGVAKDRATETLVGQESGVERGH